MESSIQISPSPVGSGSTGSSSVFSRLFTAEEVNAVGDKDSRDATQVDVQPLLAAFLNMSLRCACLSD